MWAKMGMSLVVSDPTLDMTAKGVLQGLLLVRLPRRVSVLLPLCAFVLLPPLSLPSRCWSACCVCFAPLASASAHRRRAAAFIAVERCIDS